MILEVIFWLMLITLVYTYAGYGLILLIIVRIKRWIFPDSGKAGGELYEPEVCLFVTAFNEKDYIEAKVRNAFSLNYPREKIQHIWVTDGSDDGSPEMLRKYPGIEVYHESERRGKVHAMNRGMKFVKAPLVIFSDANTRLSKNTIRDIAECFADPLVGSVAGEKRIIERTEDNASAAGESLYWKIESQIKRMDAMISSAVGGVGELFAVRTELFQPVPEDTLLDDFIITLQTVQKGYRIAYTPDAYAEETASLNVREEMKRKIRIAAGGVQTIFRLTWLFNPFRYGWFSWQYFSHKVLRWSFAPLFLFLIFPVNLLLVLMHGNGKTGLFYHALFFIQSLCYLLVLLGWLLENREIRNKYLFAPYYFVMMNLASVIGFIRYFRRRQKVTWEKSKRA